MASNGSVVPDGYYNMQFKIYQDGDGTTAGDTGGTLKWTESYVNNSTNAGVQVTNGFFSVNLGSENPFGTSIDWNQDTLWLSMNVAGSSASCSTFGTSPCTADGEMLPMKRITSSPYALNSGMLGGKTADNFIQLAQGVQTDATSNTSSIFINKTSTGNLIQLQNAATDIFTVDNTGNVQLGSNADKTISVAAAAANTDGKDLTVSAGAGGTGSGASGGNLVLQGGGAGGSNGDGGNVVIDAGAANGTGNAGTISIGATNAGTVTIGSNGSQSARFTGNTLYVGNADNSGNATTANGFTIQGTSSTASNAQGGSLTIQSGAATNGDANGGNLNLTAGSGTGSGATGLVVINTPTFQTATEQDFATDGSVSQSSIDSNGAILVKATAADVTVTVNDPTMTTAGRIIYIMTTTTSNDLTLSINGGASLNVHAGTTVPLIWNGSDWTVAGGSNVTSLQDSYNTSVQKDGKGNLTLSNGSDNNGLNLQNSSSSPVTGSLFTVKDSSADNILAVNNDNVKVGDDSGSTTLLSLDKAASAPTVDSSLVGSMYYDTTLGEVQCYEASGWGNCSSSPDDFINLSPQYTNAVMHGDGIGTMTNDLCSDDLNINDGTSGQPTICGTHETYNYYNWTSTESSDQTRSIYVTYQLPGNFKGFVDGSTSLMGRTDGSDSSVAYTVYKNETSGLTACGSAVSVSTGSQTTWQKGTATSTADPSSCDFQPGDSIVFKIDMTAKNNANAYVSTLAFALK
jgi:hypothetical protein